MRVLDIGLELQGLGSWVDRPNVGVYIPAGPQSHRCQMDVDCDIVSVGMSKNRRTLTYMYIYICVCIDT